MKVAFIGAGSLGFTRKILADILTVPEFRDTTKITFTDINKRNLELVTKLCRRDMEANGVKSELTSTLDRRAALKDANYVVCVVRVGGLEGFEMDVDIPLRYGIDQCVGDTVCAGGIMYAQRSIPVLREFCKDVSEVSAPGCVFLSHVNPMAMNTWACTSHGYGVDWIGLCHGVEGGHAQIARVLGKKRQDIDIICAGINHLGWYVQVKAKGKEVRAKRLLRAFEKHPQLSRTEKVRIDLLRRFGCYCTESNGHCSEYLPWYRKRPREIKQWIDTDRWIHGETGGYLRVCREKRDWFKTDFPGWLKAPPREYVESKRTHEHTARIIEAMETGRIYRGHFNQPNRGCISNLPDDCIIEAPGYVDRNGLSMPVVGDLPAGCAAVCNMNINTQRLAVQAAIAGDDELLRQAMMVDPLVGAVCNPPEIWQMVDELLVAQARWLPQYRKAVAAAKRRLAKGKKIKTRTGYRGAARLPVKRRRRKTA